MKISIITVVLNGVSTLEQTIQSVLGQDYPDIEYIIIDGGSTDGTLEIIKEHEHRLSFWMSERDSGIYSAMNKGLQYATGDYVGFINSDDWYEDGAIGRVADLMRSTLADVIYGDYYQVISNGNKTLMTARPLDYINISMPFCHQSVFVKRNTFSTFDVRYGVGADYKLLLDLYKTGVKFQYYSGVISNFRMGGCADNGGYNTVIEHGIIAAEALIKSDSIMLVYGPTVLKNTIHAKMTLDLFSGKNHKSIQRCLDEIVPQDDKIVIFGTGELTNKFLGFIEKNNQRIKYYIDSDKNKEGGIILQKNIHTPDYLKSEEKCSVIVLNKRYCSEIVRLINNMNLSQGVKVFSYRDFEKRFWEAEAEHVLQTLSEQYKCIERLNESLKKMDQEYINRILKCN